MIGLINYGGGNYKSVSNTLEYLNIKFSEVNEFKSLKRSSHIILPGVGTYYDLVTKLKKLNLFDELLDCIINKKVFFLGICVGMQILSDFGYEDIETKGLGLIKGNVEKIPVTNEVLPNIGWHKVNLVKNNSCFQKYKFK